MLQDYPVFSGFSVDDLEAAREFYGEKLGLKIQDQPGMGFQIHFSKGGQHFVYPKPNHEPASYTVLNFVVKDIKDVVSAMTAKGIKFLHYDLPEISTDADGIAWPPKPEYGPPIAWFTDPAGNILSVLQVSNK